MAKLLSIGIPTFNRASRLDRQLEWLANEIKGFENECEIAIYDNCSPDHTSEVVERWRPAFAGVPFSYVRNAENIGGLPNYAKFLNEATATFTWAIGDDDPIHPGTLAFVIKNLKERRNLALMYLNFTAFHEPTGSRGEECWFDTDLESQAADGKAVFRRSIEKLIGSVIFITAAVYRTKLAQVALQKWPESVHNWAGMGYWTGYCALHGDVLVTKDAFVVCTIGKSHWEKDNTIHARIWSRDVPELCFKLCELGYPDAMSRKVMKDGLKTFGNFCGRRGYLKAFRLWGTTVAATLAFVYLPFGSMVLGTALVPATSAEVEESRTEESITEIQAAPLKNQ